MTALDVSHPKPDPEMLINILSYFDVAPAETVYVGDSSLDEQAADKAGVPFIAYGNHDLSAAHHIDSFKDLERLLLF